MNVPWNIFKTMSRNHSVFSSVSLGLHNRTLNKNYWIFECFHELHLQSSKEGYCVFLNAMWNKHTSEEIRKKYPLKSMKLLSIYRDDISGIAPIRGIIDFFVLYSETGAARFFSLHTAYL